MFSPKIFFLPNNRNVSCIFESFLHTHIILKKTNTEPNVLQKNSTAPSFKALYRVLFYLGMFPPTTFNGRITANWLWVYGVQLW